MNRKARARKSVEQLNIMDDDLFEKMAEDIGFCEEVISTILNQKIRVLKATKQNSVKNLQGRSVVLDVLCITENGKVCNEEVLILEQNLKRFQM